MAVKQRTPTRKSLPASKRAAARVAPVKPASLTDQAFELLRADIVSCTLPPGSQVTEVDLCNRYQMSKAPMRAALTRIVQDGLLRAVPRHGYIVAPITLKSVQEMYDLRIIIEPALARMAVGRVDVAALRKLNHKPGANLAPDAEARFLQSNKEFHLTIARASGNSRLYELMRQIMDDMERLIHVGLFSRGWRAGANRDAHEGQAREHEELLEALSRGNANDAEAAARSHAIGSREMVLQSLMTGSSVALS